MTETRVSFQVYRDTKLPNLASIDFPSERGLFRSV